MCEQAEIVIHIGVEKERCLWVSFVSLSRCSLRYIVQFKVKFIIYVIRVSLNCGAFVLHRDS